MNQFDPFLVSGTNAEQEAWLTSFRRNIKCAIKADREFFRFICDHLPKTLPDSKVDRAITLANKATKKCCFSSEDKLKTAQDRFELLINVLPMPPVSVLSTKAATRDLKTFYRIADIYFREHGLYKGAGSKARRIVPKVYRKRRRLEQGEGPQFGTLSYPASLSEVMQYASTLPGFGSFKTVERQFYNGKKWAKWLVVFDEKTGLINRDPYFSYAAWLDHYLEN